MKVLSLHYLPNVVWMKNLLSGNCIIDIHEHFVKQTYRNRAVILSANGPLNLTIPVKKTGEKMPMKALMPDNEVNWQRQHWESIVTAYGSSPYFIHYEDGFKRIYEKPVTMVAAFELELLELIIKYMKVDAQVILSESYIASPATDLRAAISPKKNTVDAYFKTYLQVFAGKFPFHPNLSILDALFNLGPRTVDILKS